MELYNNNKNNKRILIDRSNHLISASPTPKSINNNNTSMSNNSSLNSSPKVRPLPTFFFESATFSTKKEKDNTPRIYLDGYPPKLPIKSCPPISRLNRGGRLKPGSDKARVISFKNKTSTNENGKTTRQNKK
jgi:hypothetical protein